VLEQQRAALERAVGDHHLVDVDAVEVRDPLAEPGVAAAPSVGERPLPVGVERARGRLADQLAGEDVGARGAAGEADRVCGHSARVYARRWLAYRAAATASAASWAVSVGDRPTLTPRASSASFLACAVPDEPEMIAPAWPICLPSGAVNPAM
jgi:hypothetical protein